MPYTTKADGDVVTASFWNANVRDQTIATVTSGTRPTGTEGQLIYETDTDLFQAYNGGWIPFGGLGAFTTWTPTLTQSSTVTATVNMASYIKIGRLVIGYFSLAVTGSGSANNIVTVSLPVTAASSSWHGGGTGDIRDSSATTTYPALLFANSTTACRFVGTATNVNGLYLGQTGADFAAALASGDTVNGTVIYESAS